MYYIDESNNKQHEYPTYGRQFCTYKWFKPIKPIIVSLLTGIIFLAFVISLMLVTTKSLPHGFDISYENLDFNNIGLSIYVLGSMAVAIPALWIASKIVRDRPFSSYSSARGGWNFKIFFICMLLALVFVAAPVTVRIYLATGFKSDPGHSSARAFAVHRRRVSVPRAFHADTRLMGQNPHCRSHCPGIGLRSLSYLQYRWFPEYCDFRSLFWPCNACHAGNRSILRAAHCQ